MQAIQWQLATLLADGKSKHIAQLAKILETKPQHLNNVWQTMPAHIRGLLRQHDGHWRLVRPLALLKEEQLPHLVSGLNCFLQAECTSSNDIILERAKTNMATAHRWVCITHEQSKGRGRQGKTWQNRAGECLMFSLGWAFEQAQSALTSLALLSALACQRALAELGLNAQIKWPNDLVVGRKKLGGILIETVRNEGKTLAVVGIGLNFVLPKSVENTTSIQAEGMKHLTAEVVLSAVLTSLVRHFEQFEQQGFASFMEAYLHANRDYLQSVCLLNDGQIMAEGTIVGVDTDGALQLSTADGICRMVSGEISLRRPEEIDTPSPHLSASEPAHYLLLDGGNSRLKWAWLEAGQLSVVKRAAYRDLSELAEDWQHHAKAHSKILASAVCGQDKKEQIAKVLPKAIQWLSSASHGFGVRNHYRNPEEHGADRWFNALGSRRFSHHACVVVSCGTAVTIDAITADKHYLGGTIMPGFHLMKEAMAQKTANLNRPLGKLYHFPTTTPNAIASGMMDAVCGSIMLMHSRLAARSEGETEVIITGGGAGRVANALPSEFKAQHRVRVIEHLVLHGLIYHTENQGKI